MASTAIIGGNTYFKYFLFSANCIALENEIFEEWCVYNTASMLVQLGFDLREKAREFGNQMKLDGLRDLRFGEPER